MFRAVLLTVLSLAPAARADDPPALKKVTWKIGDDTREALVYAPAGSGKKLLVFAWHGHGGTADFAARKFAFRKLWPEAVVVYPQGLPIPAPVVDPDGKRSGWQKFVGDQDDRDLKLFDAVLKTCLADYGADEARVYSAGHSSGGFFTYLLAAARPGKLTAIAPVAEPPDSAVPEGSETDSGASCGRRKGSAGQVRRPAEDDRRDARTEQVR